MMIMLATSWLGIRASARGAERTFRGLHLVSAGAYSLGHGLNDAQKTMGVITVLLYSTGYLHGEFAVPHWVALSCYVAIGLGTLTGGWRIIETMGTRITKLNQHQGFSASAGGSVMLFAASYLGIPVSTTHTITGCVIGAGAARRASAVRWGIARNVMVAWIITIPASATVAALFYWLVGGYVGRALAGGGGHRAVRVRDLRVARIQAAEGRRRAARRGDRDPRLHRRRDRRCSMGR